MSMQKRTIIKHKFWHRVSRNMTADKRTTKSAVDIEWIHEMFTKVMGNMQSAMGMSIKTASEQGERDVCTRLAQSWGICVTRLTRKI